MSNMSKVIVMGHGGYGTALKRSLAMLVGELEGFYFLDFNETDSLDDLNRQIDALLPEVGGDGVLFACDVAGGSPFRTAAERCLQHPDWAVVAGINTSAYSEISLNLELSTQELAEMACEVARDTILMFPAREEA